MDQHIEELAKLQELREHGTISDAEFQELKDKILRSSAVGSPLPPPPVPPAPTRKSRSPLIASAVIALLVVGGVVAYFVTKGGSKPNPVRVTYTLEIVTPDPCSDFSETGYSDIPFAEAEIVDGSGNLLGFGTLDGGYDTEDSCIFTAKFEIDRSPDGKYRATAGNVNRGYVNYAESDVKNDRLAIDAVIGE